MDLFGVFIIGIMLVSIIIQRIQRKIFKKDADLVTATVEKSGLCKTENGFKSECIVNYLYNNKEYTVDIGADRYKVGSKVNLYVNRKYPDKFILKKQSYIAAYIVIATMCLFIYAGIALNSAQQILIFCNTFCAS